MSVGLVLDCSNLPGSLEGNLGALRLQGRLTGWSRRQIRARSKVCRSIVEKTNLATTHSGFLPLIYGGGIVVANLNSDVALPFLPVTSRRMDSET